jgi:hypothetical protein
MSWSSHRPPSNSTWPTCMTSSASPRRRQQTAHQAHHPSSGQLPITRRQTRHPTRPPTHQRDAPPSRTRRHRDDRPLARPREHQDHLHLPPRRQQAQTRSDRPHRTPRHPTRQIPAPRQPPRVPRITDDYADQPTAPTRLNAGKTNINTIPDRHNRTVGIKGGAVRTRATYPPRSQSRSRPRPSRGSLL